MSDAWLMVWRFVDDRPVYTLYLARIKHRSNYFTKAGPFKIFKLGRTIIRLLLNINYVIITPLWRFAAVYNNYIRELSVVTVQRNDQHSKSWSQRCIACVNQPTFRLLTSEGYQSCLWYAKTPVMFVSIVAQWRIQRYYVGDGSRAEGAGWDR